MHTDRWLDLLFGMGDDDFPYWLMAVRTNILLWMACVIGTSAYALAPHRLRRIADARLQTGIAIGLTVLAVALRFGVASANLLDFGGIPYSRLLLGYKGHFAIAQTYSLFYEVFGRTIENAILLNRIAGVLTVPLVYALCLRLELGRQAAVLAALLLAASPVHIMFSASDSLGTFSMFLAVVSYLSITVAVSSDAKRSIRAIAALGGFLGLTLLTQVRYENVLFALPVAVYLLAHYRTVPWRLIGPAATVAAVFVAFYAVAASNAGLSYQNPVLLSQAWPMVRDHLILNPFAAVPILLLGTLAVLLMTRMPVGILAALPLPGAIALALLSESGHGAVRVYSTWLVLILPIAAYGYSLVLDSEWRLPRWIGGAAVALLLAQPIVTGNALGTRYLEIREHDFFRLQVAQLPATVERLIVPDDMLMRRRYHSTVELYNKYSMTLAGVPEIAGRITVVELTTILEDETPEKTCRPGTCAFFRGLPCAQQNVYRLTPEQCDALQKTTELQPLHEQTIESAPFRDCAVYVGEQRRELCEPAVRDTTFGIYLIRDWTRLKS